MAKPNGYLLFEGASELDGEPIMVIATGFKKRRNPKTGDMLQTWIMRQDIHPMEAVRSGDDFSICGGCPHRPKLNGACYVRVGQAPASIYRAHKRGLYEAAEAAEVLAGHRVRLGAYGDPAAVPLGWWRDALKDVTTCTGYTHQWRDCDPGFSSLVMASVDTPGEAIEAREKGWRTFRIRTADEPIMKRLEFVCPASAEAGKKTTCGECNACGGLSSKAKASPVIFAHGATARRFEVFRNGIASRVQ